MSGAGFNASPVRAVVVKDDCCEQEGKHCDFVNSAIRSMRNVELSIVGCSELLGSIKAIRKDAEIIFIPFLRGCKRNAAQIIRQIRKERNGVPIVAWGEEASVDDQIELFNAGADYVSKRTHLFERDSLSYLLHTKVREKNKP